MRQQGWKVSGQWQGKLGKVGEGGSGWLVRRWWQGVEWWEIGEMERREVSAFIQEWGTHGES